MRTITGRIMNNENGKPTLITRTITPKEGKPYELEICRFRVIRDKMPGAEPIQVETLNRGVMPHITAGRHVMVQGEDSENPRVATNKEGKTIVYANPRIQNAEITLLDTPLRKQIPEVLSLLKEQNLIDDETYEKFNSELQAKALEIFESGRQVEEKQKTVESQPSGSDDTPL